MKFLVIGGDAAGMSAASRAKRNRTDLEVTGLEKTMDVSYSACGMPDNIAEPDRDMGTLVVRKADVFREKQGLNPLTGHNAIYLDPVRCRVEGTAPGGFHGGQGRRGSQNQRTCRGFVGPDDRIGLHPAGSCLRLTIRAGVGSHPDDGHSAGKENGIRSGWRWPKKNDLRRTNRKRSF